MESALKGKKVVIVVVEPKVETKDWTWEIPGLDIFMPYMPMYQAKRVL
jgi:hypothetical protein